MKTFSEPLISSEFVTRCSSKRQQAGVFKALLTVFTVPCTVLQLCESSAAAAHKPSHSASFYLTACAKNSEGDLNAHYFLFHMSCLIRMDLNMSNYKHNPFRISSTFWKTLIFRGRLTSMKILISHSYPKS